MRPLTYAGAGARPWSVGEILDRSDRAFARMANALTLWQAIAEIFYPERADFTVQMTPGDERYWDIFDEEPMLLRRNLANQIGAMIRPRGREWFMAKAFPRRLNQDDAVRRWCEDATETQRDVIYAPRANFTKAFSESDNDYVAFGTSVVTHTYNSDRTGLIFRCLHPRDCAWAENQDGIVDEMHERMKITLRQIDEMGFVIPSQWTERYQKDANQEVEVRRCVYPIARYQAHENTARLPRSARFAVMYMAPECRAELKTKSGTTPFFRTWPYLVRRWTQVSGEPFGRSPCTSVALATSRTLNQAQLAIIESLEKLVNPPLVAPHDGIVGEVAIRANGVSYYDPQIDYGSRKPIDAIEVGRPDFGMEYTAERRAFLARAFLQDLIRFPAMDGKERTAYEIQKLYDQYLRDAAPVFEPMEAENGDVMEGVFERIMDADGPGKWGGFAPPPDVLRGAEVKFEFETPLSSAYRRLKFEKANEVNTYLANRAQANPGILDLIDNDAMDREALETIAPAKWLLPEEVVMEKRQQKAQQDQIREAAALAIEAGKAKLIQTPQEGQPPLG